MERIQDMLWDQRDLDPAVIERERAFLLDKGSREPENGEVYTLLADMENTLAASHRRRAAAYAKEALTREPAIDRTHYELTAAMQGRMPDWFDNNHMALIDWYKNFLEKHPDCHAGLFRLLDQLIDAGRLVEARKYLEKFSRFVPDMGHVSALFAGWILWGEGRREIERLKAKGPGGLSAAQSYQGKVSSP